MKIKSFSSSELKQIDEFVNEFLSGINSDFLKLHDIKMTALPQDDEWNRIYIVIIIYQENESVDQHGNPLE